MRGAAITSDLTGRRALVTGGASGIGLAIVRALAGIGYGVAIADIDADAATAEAEALGPGHVALAVDLTDIDAARALVGRAQAALGGLDVVINNAGATDSSGRSIADLGADRFDRLVALNLMACEVIALAALDALPQGGSIVNLASGAAYRPLALRGPYSATKAGVVELTHALAATARSRGLSISAIAPGYTRTPLVAELEREGRVDLAKVAATIPMGRIAEPEDIARAVAFAAAPEGAALTGATFLVDGGGNLGAPVANTAPASGTGNGADVVLGDADLAEILGAADRLTDDTISALIDARLLNTAHGLGETLAHLRACAETCAGSVTRAHDFSMTFVIAAGTDLSTGIAEKAADMLVRTLALEWAPGGFRVNAIIWRGKGREGLAGLCRFLASEDAAFVTGQVIRAGST